MPLRFWPSAMASASKAEPSRPFVVMFLTPRLEGIVAAEEQRAGLPGQRIHPDVVGLLLGELRRIREGLLGNGVLRQADAGLEVFDDDVEHFGRLWRSGLLGGQDSGEGDGEGDS